jgi:hypothetical protein
MRKGLAAARASERQGDVCIQTIESSVLKRDEVQNHADPRRFGKDGRAVATWSKMPIGKAFVPKTRKLASGIVQQLDQVGPSLERRAM